MASRVALRPSVARRSGVWDPRNDGQIGTSLLRTGALRDVECRNRTAKTLQLKVSEILQPCYRFTVQAVSYARSATNRSRVQAGSS